MAVKGDSLLLRHLELDRGQFLQRVVECQVLLAQFLEILVQRFTISFVEDVDPFQFLVQVIEQEAAE